MTVHFKTFTSSTSWDKCFNDAARFASSIDPQNLITIDSTLDRSTNFADGRVTVWWWA